MNTIVTDKSEAKQLQTTTKKKNISSGIEKQKLALYLVNILTFCFVKNVHTQWRER